MREATRVIDITPCPKGMMRWILALAGGDLEKESLHHAVQAYFIINTFPALTGKEVMMFIEGELTVEDINK